MVVLREHQQMFLKCRTGILASLGWSVHTLFRSALSPLEDTMVKALTTSQVRQKGI